MLEDAFDLSACIGEEEKHSASASLAPGQRGEIFWRRRWPVVVILTVVFGLLLWGGADLLIRREPDVQIAVVRTQPLPDSVRTALEVSWLPWWGTGTATAKPWPRSTIIP